MIDPEKVKERKRRYTQSEKGIATRRAYEKGRERTRIRKSRSELTPAQLVARKKADARYAATEKGRAAKRAAADKWLAKFPEEERKQYHRERSKRYRSNKAKRTLRRQRREAA